MVALGATVTSRPASVGSAAHGIWWRAPVGTTTTGPSGRLEPAEQELVELVAGLAQRVDGAGGPVAPADGEASQGEQHEVVGRGDRLERTDVVRAGTSGP